MDNFSSHVEDNTFDFSKSYLYTDKTKGPIATMSTFEIKESKAERSPQRHYILIAVLVYLVLLTFGAGMLAYKVFSLQEQISLVQQTEGTPSTGKYSTSLFNETPLNENTIREEHTSNTAAANHTELNILNEHLNKLYRRINNSEADSGTGCAKRIIDLEEEIKIVQVQYVDVLMRMDNITLTPGPPGFKGSKGDPGDSGLQGIKGKPGGKGEIGFPGIPGMKGEKGTQGLQGRQGEDGTMGKTGPAGLDGVPGNQGEKGNPGLNGVKGEDGLPGQKGKKGELGTDGPAGFMGPPGPPGPPAEKGEKGDHGDNGNSGAPGKAGLPGPKGDKGNAGMPGTEGTKGDQGIAGIRGPEGAMGRKGDSGVIGQKGEPGKNGINGMIGQPGVTGPPGAKGEKGDQGLPGPPGAKGEKSDQVRVVDPLVRMIGDLNQGRVEVKYNEEWGTICDDDWDINDGHVVCRMLGYARAIKTFTVGGGTGKILLDDVACTGQEASIYDCPKKQWGQNNCNHSEDAGVQCAV